jgi:hypothetical protein
MKFEVKKHGRVGESGVGWDRVVWDRGVLCKFL